MIPIRMYYDEHGMETYSAGVSCAEGRDYSILMLAMHIGLRGIDILRLTFTSINQGKEKNTPD